MAALIEKPTLGLLAWQDRSLQFYDKFDFKVEGQHIGTVVLAKDHLDVNRTIVVGLNLAFAMIMGSFPDKLYGLPCSELLSKDAGVYDLEVAKVSPQRLDEFRARQDPDNPTDIANLIVATGHFTVNQTGTGTQDVVYANSVLNVNKVPMVLGHCVKLDASKKNDIESITNVSVALQDKVREMHLGETGRKLQSWVEEEFFEYMQAHWLPNQSSFLKKATRLDPPIHVAQLSVKNTMFHIMENTLLSKEEKKNVTNLSSAGSCPGLEGEAEYPFQMYQCRAMVKEAHSRYASTIKALYAIKNDAKAAQILRSNSVDSSVATGTGPRIGMRYEDQGEIMAKGSVGHPNECQKPCMFFLYSKRGCFSGLDCEYCHCFHISTRAAKRQKFRESIRLKKAESRSVSGVGGSSTASQSRFDTASSVGNLNHL